MPSASIQSCFLFASASSRRLKSEGTSSTEKSPFSRYSRMFPQKNGNDGFRAVCFSKMMTTSPGRKSACFGPLETMSRNSVEMLSTTSESGAPSRGQNTTLRMLAQGRRLSYAGSPKNRLISSRTSDGRLEKKRALSDGAWAQRLYARMRKDAVSEYNE